MTARAGKKRKLKVAKGWRWQWSKRRVVLLGLAVVVGAFFLYTAGPKLRPDQVAWGVTYSNHEAKDLKLDPQQTYLSVLDELQPKRLRLVAYWSDIEKQRGQYDFQELDFQVDEAEKRGIQYVITVGIKLPRWPECFAPDWAAKLPAAEEQQQLFAMDEQTVSRYDQRPHLAGWQVENEPYLKFGQGCPGFVGSALPDEVKLVRSLSAKKIRLTDSGEFSTWYLASRFGDEFGTTLYRAVLMQNTQNVFHYFWWPDFYTRRATLIKKLHPNVQSVVISELQAEPWGLAPGLPQAFYNKTMSHEQFLANISFAGQVGLDEADLWGVEWWYYEKQHGDSFYWDAARDLFAHSAD